VVVVLFMPEGIVGVWRRKILPLFTGILK